MQADAPPEKEATTGEKAIEFMHGVKWFLWNLACFVLYLYLIVKTSEFFGYLWTFEYGWLLVLNCAFIIALAFFNIDFAAKTFIP